MKAFQAKKHLAQHFLTDEHVISRIVKVISPRADETFVEIGPGLGALTAPLLKHNTHLDAIEIDPRLAEKLTRQFASYETFTLHCQDALKFDFTQPSNGGKVRIVGNLPYNISTPLLLRLFNACKYIHDMHIMLQAEVAERIVAKPGTRNYSRLGVVANCFTKAHHLFDIAPSAFSPPPQVNSSIVRLLPQPCPIEPQSRQAFFDLVKKAFSQRRKTIGRIFSGIFNAQDFAQIGISTAARPEELEIKDFLAMLNLLGSKRTINMENK